MISNSARFPEPPDVERTSRPLRIAVVYSRIPVPMRRADQMTVAHLIKFLHTRGHEVDLHCVDTGAKADEQDHAWLQQNTRKVYLYPHTFSSILAGLAKVLFQLVPVQVGLFSNPAQRSAIRAMVGKGDYDIVYTYYFRSAEVTKDIGRELPAGDGNPQGPVTFLAMQLSQTLNTRRIAANAPDLPHRLFYTFESSLVARYEARIWRHFTRSVLIGRSDVKEIQGTCKAQGQPMIDNYVFGAHGTDVSRFAPRTDIEEQPRRLVFSGVMRTPTNVAAVQWFVRNVWPLIYAAVPDTEFAIVGREPSSEVQALAQVAGVIVVGGVPDTSVPIAEATICVNPMQAGGGMQNKLIEYLASGKAIVATSVANEGINAEAGKHLIVADDPKEFAAAVIELLLNPDRRRELGQAGREYALSNWTWEWHFLKLENDFYRALDGAPALETQSK